MNFGHETDVFFERAGLAHTSLQQVRWDCHAALYNQGNTLVARARQASGAEADDLYAQAGEKFAAALRIKPDKHEALNNWGNALLYQARTKTGMEAEDLFELACEKYAAALAIKANKYEALNNWGAALSDRARMRAGERAEVLFARADEKFAAALKIKRNYLEALDNWGTTLLLRYHNARETGKKQVLIAKARGVYLCIEKLVPGRAAYDLACIHALGGEHEQCRYWLDRSRAAGTLPGLEHLQEDRDLDPVRKTSWFRGFLEKLGGAFHGIQLNAY
jgi:tetratricopeptide (TPR) repeat protein